MKNSINPDKNLIVKYVILTVVFTVLIGIFSLVMASIASYRNEIGYKNYESMGRLYSGPLEQSAPSLDMMEKDSEVYIKNNLTPERVKKYIDNTALASTDAQVIIDADFVKKGLILQPTYKTNFKATYILKNDLSETSVISFVFPLPVNTDTNEISNAKLIVDGEDISNAKTQIKQDNTYDDFYYAPPANDGLKWEGEIAANDSIKIDVSYNTVGLSVFTYEGIENSKGSQDFNFEVRINGTRSYDVITGLSVDEREFGENYVVLTWNKPALYSKPLVKVGVGDKLNPSTQVSRVYMTMAPVYLIFITILLFLTYKFGKKMAIFDMFLFTVLFVVYFPFVHYLSSFTIDPTIEVFSNWKDVVAFSMPLYLAFAVAISIVGGLMYYFLGRISGFKFSTKFGIPSLILFIGFFPLVVTIPEYSMLLVIIGVIALISIILQVRINMINMERRKT